MTCPTTAGQVHELPLPRPDVGLLWGIKSSLLDYLARLDGSRVELSDGSGLTDSRRFHFPPEHTNRPRDGILRFAGSVRLTAYRGLLDVTITAPWIELAGSLLTYRRHDGARVPLARLAPRPPTEWDDTSALIDVSTFLHPEARPLFDGAYAAGEPFDPLSARVFEARDGDLPADANPVLVS